MKYLAGICALFMSCAALAGHHKEGESAVDHTSAAWQIKAYSSAAPDFWGTLRQSSVSTAQFCAREPMVGSANQQIQDRCPAAGGALPTKPCRRATTARE